MTPALASGSDISLANTRGTPFRRAFTNPEQYGVGSGFRIAYFGLRKRLSLEYPWVSGWLSRRRVRPVVYRNPKEADLAVWSSNHGTSPERHLNVYPRR